MRSPPKVNPEQINDDDDDDDGGLTLALAYHVYSTSVTAFVSLCCSWNDHHIAPPALTQ